ncbi:protein HEG homolog 1 isoform X2 [Sorex araneus]|uniref:protein HEG homolog 1 isoform X2 n=1 Tax=Sorex araneus TaxID=42254 RepID=UPI0024339956|nr:protein HEG homolog 1 isoform X2 [Sorex araneus]
MARPLALLLLLLLPPPGPAALRDRWLESHTSTQAANLTWGQDQANFTAAASRERVSDQTPGKSLISADTPEAFMAQTETAASAATEVLTGLSTLRSPSTRQADSVPVAHSVHSSVQPALQSLTVSLSLGLPRDEERFPGVSDLSTGTSRTAALSLSEAEPRGSEDALHDPGEGRFSKSGFVLPSSGVGFQPNDSQATEYSSELGFSTDVEERTFQGTLGAHAHAPQTAATSTGNGERTLRSLPSQDASTFRDPGHPAATPVQSESVPLRGNATAPGVTGVSLDPASDLDLEPQPDDHTYISSAFTKGERALLSITENSASRPPAQASSEREPGARAEGSRGPWPAGTPARPPTVPLVLGTARPPRPAPTASVPSTLALLGARAASGAAPSSPPSLSSPPWSLPSVLHTHQPFSPTLLSTRPSTPLRHPTAGAPAPLSFSTPPSLAASGTLTPAPPAAFRTTAVLPRTSVWMTTLASSEAALPSGQTADPESLSQADLEKVTRGSEALTPGSLQTEAPKAGAMNSTSSTPGFPGPAPLAETTEPALSATSSRLAQTSPAVVTTLQASPPLTPTSSPAASTVGPAASSTTVQTETEKLLPTSPGIVMPPVTTEGPVTMQRSPERTEATPGPTFPTGAPTPTVEATLEPGLTGEHAAAVRPPSPSPAPRASEASTHELLTPRSQRTTQAPGASPASASSCATNPCLHGGRCVEELPGLGHRCVCLPSWQGDDCSVDVNECLSNPCPPLAVCNNTQGSFICKCPVGYQLEKGICNLVRTFIAELKIKKTLLNATTELPEVESEITRMLNACFSPVPGYTQSTAQASGESSAVTMALHTTFSLASNVTLFDLADRVQRCASSCRASAELCHLLAAQRRFFRAGSLCRHKTPECDRETSLCTDLDGVARCQCKLGYFQFNKMDHSCRACEDGYRLENETCLSCPFGLGGLNCGNPYQLITVVIAAAGGGLLLILGIALILTCCRKNKNDISKLIFKSGDFQMSPYAEYPKNPRSQEWGREAIEMHENGSTKNLLQMTDVYYSPTNVRNPELERNGLYPAYTGLPGSRHSCIFPGQYNPSFISDESRRRDYF